MESNVKDGSYNQLSLLEVADQTRNEDCDLERRIRELELKEVAIRQRLVDFDREWAFRKQTILDELRATVEEKASATWRLKRTVRPEELGPPPVGPVGLLFVEEDWFRGVCTFIIVVNIVMMFVELHTAAQGSLPFQILDNTFLVWYIIELLLKALLYQKQLLCGRIDLVLFNWLDLGIVTCGIGEQWIVPFLSTSGGKLHGLSPNCLRMLRVLRLVRVARIVKAMKNFLLLDLEWVDGRAFQGFIMFVIFINAVILGCELDIDWEGWFWVEHALLSIYTFELVMRLKRSGLVNFLYESLFNVLDFVIVLGGMLDQWLIPLISLIRSLTFPAHASSQHHHKSSKGFWRLVRMMRLLRALRLVRLLRSIRPLYDLMNGIVEAMQSVGWVLILTLVLLYAAAVVFTNLIGHGMIYEHGAPEEAREIFGSVLMSMFNLFKLMNDDQSVVGPIIDSVVVKLAFMGTMIVMNWMVLAVLTSVVSDRMISSTQQHEAELAAKAKAAAHMEAARRVRQVFERASKNGIISFSDFCALMEDEFIVKEINDATGLELHDVEELFDFNVRFGQVHADEFLDRLMSQGTSTTERSIMRLERMIRDQEHRLEERMGSILEAMRSSDQFQYMEKRMSRKAIDDRSAERAKKRVNQRVASDFSDSSHSPTEKKATSWGTTMFY